MKICYVASNIEVPYRGGLGSGGSTHVYEVAKGLYKKGHSVYVLCSRIGNQPINENVDGIIIHRIFRFKEGILWNKLKKNKLLWLIISPFCYTIKFIAEHISLFLFLRRNPVDIVYERSNSFHFMRSLLYLILGAPLVLEVNDYCYNIISLIIAKVIITPNKKTLAFYLRNKIIVLHWGVNIEMFRPDIDASQLGKLYKLENKKVALLVCSGLPWHGINELIEAAREVVQKIDNVVFLVVGNVGDLVNYKKNIDKFGLKDKFISIGPISYSQIPEFISLADIALAPYNSLLNKKKKRALYSSPLKVLEYMACGKPVVITRIGNINNIIEDTKTGIVIPEDSPGELANAIIRLLNDKELCDYLGRNARKVVEQRFSWRAHVEELNKVFESLI